MYKLWPENDFHEMMGQVIEKAKDCIQCGECLERCPYNLPIPELIEEYVAFYY